jgi:AcrR family transcriptional regulator
VTEEQVLSRALTAFATYGYDAVSMRMLASDLGVSHNLLHQKYGSKLSLWYAAVDRAFTPLAEALYESSGAAVEPIDRLQRFVESFALYSAEHPDSLRLVNLEGSIPGERLDYLCDQFIVPVYRHLLPTYRQLVADGTLRRIPIATLYYLITSGCAAMFTSAELTGKLFGEKALGKANHRKHAREAARIIVEGLRVR